MAGLARQLDADVVAVAGQVSLPRQAMKAAGVLAPRALVDRADGTEEPFAGAAGLLRDTIADTVSTWVRTRSATRPGA